MRTPINLDQVQSLRELTRLVPDSGEEVAVRRPQELYEGTGHRSAYAKAAQPQPSAPASTLFDIFSMPPDRRPELFRRLRARWALVAGSRVGSPVGVRPRSLAVKAPRLALEVHDDRLHLELDNAELDLRFHDDRVDASRPPEMLLLRAFEALLEREGPEAEAIANLYLSLFGVRGAFSDARSGVRPFFRPHLIAYDLNGTALGRSGIGPITSALKELGASSVITTSVSAGSGERAMNAERAAFDGFFGGDVVLPNGARNKCYAKVAETFGIDRTRAKDELIVVGDSARDQPGDLPGVVFVHNDNQTPAEVLLILFRALDDAGEGSFALGLERLKDGVAGPLMFDVSENEHGPVISNLRVAIKKSELEKLLRVPPGADDTAGSAAYALALRALPGATLETIERALHPEVLQDPAFVELALKKALARFALDKPAFNVVRAHRAIGKLVSSSELDEALHNVTDKARASILENFAEHNQKALAEARASLPVFASYVGVLARFGESGQRFKPIYETSRAHQRSNAPRAPDRAVLERAAREGLPADLEGRAALIEALQLALSFPAEEPLFAQIREAAAKLEALEEKTTELFEVRRAVAKLLVREVEPQRPDCTQEQLSQETLSGWTVFLRVLRAVFGG